MKTTWKQPRDTYTCPKCLEEMMVNKNYAQRLKKGYISNYCNQCKLKLPQGIAARNRVFFDYQANARKKNILFDLEYEKFISLTDSNCFYCNAEPSNISKSSSRGNITGSYIYNGIDKINPDGGYVIDNVVTCCKTCNWAKQKMTVEEFKKWVEKIYLNFIKNNQ